MEDVASDTENGDCIRYLNDKQKSKLAQKVLKSMDLTNIFLPGKGADSDLSPEEVENIMVVVNKDKKLKKAIK